MTRTIFRAFLAFSGSILIVQGAAAQDPGPGIPEYGPVPPAATVVNTLAAENTALSVPASSVTRVVGVAATSVGAAKHYSSFLTRERTTMGVVADAYLEFYPSDEYLRILSSPGRPLTVAAPFKGRLKAENVTSSIPGIPPATMARLYKSDSSLGSLVAWYTKEYGFDFKISRTPLRGSARDTVTVARAVKQIGNTLVTMMIWNPTSAPKGKKSKNVSFTNKTSVEIQERAYRPRGELIVEGPDAVVELTWKVPYRDLIQQVSVKYQIDPHLIAALVQQESNFNPSALSVDSAMGLTQMIPGTAAMLGIRDPNNPKQALDGGARYLKMLLGKFKGNVEYALAGYNAGPGNVVKYNGIPPFAETRDYVRRIMARYKEKAGGSQAKVAKVVTPKI